MTPRYMSCMDGTRLQGPKKGLKAKISEFTRPGPNYKMLWDKITRMLEGPWKKCPPECLQNCPRNVERSSSSEDSFGGTRADIFGRGPRAPGDFNIITQNSDFPPDSDFVRYASPWTVIMADPEFCTKKFLQNIRHTLTTSCLDLNHLQGIRTPA